MQWQEPILSSAYSRSAYRFNLLCAPHSPQPFEVNEVVVSGKIYPSDRLYVDDKTFLINVVLEVCLKVLHGRHFILMSPLDYVSRKISTSRWKSPMRR